MCDPGRRVLDVEPAARGVGLPVRVPRCADRPRCGGAGAVLRGRAPAGGHVRAGDAALRPGRDGLVRQGRAGVGRLARGCRARVGRAGTAGGPARSHPAAAGGRGAVRRRRGRADRRGGAGRPAGPGGRGGGGRGSRPTGAARFVPRTVGPAGAARAPARGRLQLRGDQHGGLLHPRPGPGGVAGRGAVARHRPGRGGGGDGRGHHRLRAHLRRARHDSRPSAAARWA